MNHVTNLQVTIKFKSDEHAKLALLSRFAISCITSSCTALTWRASPNLKPEHRIWKGFMKGTKNCNRLRETPLQEISPVTMYMLQYKPLVEYPVAVLARKHPGLVGHDGYGTVIQNVNGSSQACGV